MNGAERQTLRRSILSATRQIGELARMSAWNETLELVSERQDLLETLFGAGGAFDAGGESDEVELVREVLKADGLLAGLAEAGRRETLTELETHIRTHNALVAYQAESQSDSF